MLSINHFKPGWGNSYRRQMQIKMYFRKEKAHQLRILEFSLTYELWLFKAKAPFFLIVLYQF